MALTERQKKAREGKLTASAVACLMDGNEERIMQLWLELTGDPSFVPPNFDDNWHVKLGECTERLNLDWFAKKYGPVIGRGKVCVHPEIAWAAATLDGWSVDHNCPIETKHLIGFTKTPEAAVKYMPQMQWQMLITDSEQCAFSPIQGGREPEVLFVPFDAKYTHELLDRATRFMEHVRNMTPPVAMPAVDAPKPPAEKTYDMRANKTWCALEKIWLENAAAAEAYDEAADALKKMMPDDAAYVSGPAMEIKRNKAGSLSLKLRKAK